MKLLEEKIVTCGRVLPGEILKVDSFLNHQIDVELIIALGREFFDLFRNEGVNKILTVESSGIAIAFAAAQFFRVPVVFAKKGAHKNVGADVYTGECFSYTKPQNACCTLWSRRAQSLSASGSQSKKAFSPAGRSFAIREFASNPLRSWSLWTTTVISPSGHDPITD